MSKPVPVYRNMFNEFEANVGPKTINFRNETSKRNNVTSIEIHNGGEVIKDIRIKPEDNAAMALAVLGIGRVTDEVEQLAHDAANGKTEEELIRFAVINLRAIQLLREEKQSKLKKDLDDAFALYQLAYPDAAVTRSEFPDQSMHKFWLANLKKIRKDPTALGSL